MSYGVLSLWKLRVGAEAYYLSQVARGIDDYYSGNRESQGRWVGTGSQILNLGEAVTGDDLRAVLAGLVPGTGLSPNGTQIRPFKGRVPGFDLTFSAPKSVSVLYAFADPLVRAEVTDAVDTAVQEALRWLEREACLVRRGSNNRRARTPAFERWGTQRLPGAGFIAAAFKHRTSRAGDPQLHIHVLVANLTRGPDGRWSALDGQALYRAKLAAGVVFQTALRSELTRRLGVEWRPIENHVADIAGIAKRVLSHFSKRRNEIEDELERSGLSGAAAAAEATLATRTAKVEIDQETLDERWLDDGATIEFGPKQVDKLLSSCRPTPMLAALTDGTRITIRSVDEETGEVTEELATLDNFARIVASRLPERDAAVTRFEVQNEVADLLAGAGSASVLERLSDYVLARPELVPLPAPVGADVEMGWEQRWTTRRMLQIETEVRAMVTPTRVERFAMSPAAIDAALIELDAGLGPDQVDTVRRVCSQGLAVELVVGRAGTGKTYAMNAVRHVLATQERRLIGVCPTGKAARELAEGAHIEAFTVPRFLRTVDVGADDVIVIDEAGMCGTTDLHRILTRATDVGAKVILVGDHRQLPEVAAGGGFQVALDSIGDLGCELTINRRQDEAWERDALDRLRVGDIDAFWEQYRAHDRVTIIEDRNELHAAALDAWWRDYATGDDTHLIAGTRAEARLLNRLARRIVEAHGQLTGPTFTVEDRAFRAGDRVVLLRNKRGQTNLATGRRCRVENGTIATIERVHRNGEIDIAVLGKHPRRIRLTNEYVKAGYVDHGYATTIHKAQGVTCDHVHVVGPAGLFLEAIYTAMSRARRSARLYATSREAAIVGEPAHTTGIPHASERVDDLEADLLQAISVSRARQFITNEHPELARAADLAHEHDLAALTGRLSDIRTVIADLAHAGIHDPSDRIHTMQLASAHRRLMHVGGRVNARDFDNIGTIQALHDTAGEAIVRFVSDTGNTAVRTLPWHLLKPIDHPEPAVLTDDAVSYLDALAHHASTLVDEWQQTLHEHGIDVNETRLVHAAIEHRTEQLARALRSMPPSWLTWWAGERPTDPTAAVVYDDYIRDLACWRDTQRLADDTPGFGPPPTDPNLLTTWRVHTDQAITTRRFLLDATPEPTTVAALDPAHARARLDELDALLATAPPDQRLIVDRLLTADGDDLTDVIDATIASIQQARRDWILEHWPHIVEHHELAALLATHHPLAHWPTPPSQETIDLLDELARLTASDDPELTPLTELDRLTPHHDREIEADRLRDERAQVRRELQRLAEQHEPDQASAELTRQHRGRLRERAWEIECAIDRLNARATLTTWRTNSVVADRIEGRIDHLVHVAAKQRDAWLVDVAHEMLALDDKATGNVLAVAREVAAKSERDALQSPWSSTRSRRESSIRVSIDR